MGNGGEIFKSESRRWVKGIVSREESKNKDIEAEHLVRKVQERINNLFLAGVESERK